MNEAAQDDWRGYLLGHLDDEDAARLERRLLADPAAGEALQEALTDLHDDYAREQLGVADHAAFRRRLLQPSAAQRARQRFAQAMKPQSDAVRRSPRRAPAMRPAAGRPSGTLLAGALIAAALALTLSMNPQWLASNGPATAPAAARPVDAAAPTVLLLAPAAGATTIPEIALTLSARARELRVQAEVPAPAGAIRYRLRLLAADDDAAASLFEDAALTPRSAGDWHHVEARLPAALLLGETRRVVLDTVPPAPPATVVWRVRAPRRTAPELALPPP